MIRPAATPSLIRTPRTVKPRVSDSRRLAEASSGLPAAVASKVKRASAGALWTKARIPRSVVGLRSPRPGPKVTRKPVPNGSVMPGASGETCKGGGGGGGRVGTGGAGGRMTGAPGGAAGISGVTLGDGTAPRVVGGVWHGMTPEEVLADRDAYNRACGE